MILEIEISNVNSAEASSIVAICSGAVDEVNKKKSTDDIFQSVMSFSCKPESPSPIVSRETTPFSRYMQKPPDSSRGTEDS